MPGLDEIRRRIAGVKSTQKITRAMKMVAAAKLRRAHEALLTARPYAHHMSALTASLIAGTDPESHPLLQAGTGDMRSLIVVTADRGLCGAFNTNIVNEALRLLREQFADLPVRLTVIGRKGMAALQRRGRGADRSHAGLFEKYSVNASVRIVDEAVEDFLSGQAREVWCLYHEFKTALTQDIVLDRLLPYQMPSAAEAAVRPNYLFEPNREAILHALIRANLYAQMHRMLHESAASECGARRAAMEAATKNAGDVLDALALRYHRARQDAITLEMIEVVGGAQAP